MLNSELNEHVKFYVTKPLFKHVDFVKRQAQLERSERCFKDYFPEGVIVYVKPADKIPVSGEKDWTKVKRGEQPIDTCIDETPIKYINYGVSAQALMVVLDVDSDDDLFLQIVNFVAAHLQLDMRFAFGRSSRSLPTHFLFRVVGGLELLNKFKLKPVYRNGKVHSAIEVFFSLPDKKGNNDSNRQTLVPGSVYESKSDPGAPDLSVWFGPEPSTTARSVSPEDITRLVSWSCIIYEMVINWTEGSRHNISLRFGGVLARMVHAAEEGEDNESPLEQSTFHTVSKDEHAKFLFDAVCNFAGDSSQKGVHIRSYDSARKHLRADNPARVPGFSALGVITTEYSGKAVREWAQPGVNQNLLAAVVDRFYVLESRQELTYIDMDKFRLKLPYEISSELMRDRISHLTIMIGTKFYPVSKIFASSNDRMRISKSTLMPNLPPGAVVSMRNDYPIPNDYDGPMDQVVQVFNSFSGYPHDAAEHPDKEVGKYLIDTLMTILGFITQDNEYAINKVLSWIADLIQNTGTLPRIAVVFFGEKRLGKSTIMNFLIPALVGGAMSGSTSESSLVNRFHLEDFEGKSYVSLNDAKKMVNEGKLALATYIKDVRVRGEVKYGRGMTYSNNCVRVAVSTNDPEFSISLDGLSDPVLFVCRTHTAVSKGMSQEQFDQWRTDIRNSIFEPFYKVLESDPHALPHFMYFFKNFKYDRNELARTEKSASNDEDLARANTKYEVRAVADMIANGNVNGIPLGKPIKDGPGAGKFSTISKADVNEDLRMSRDTNSKYVITTDSVIAVFEKLTALVRKESLYAPTMNLAKMAAKFKEVYKFDPAPGAKFDDPADVPPDDIHVPSSKYRRF